MANRIQYRRDTAANWTAANPILALGEPGLETDTKKRKIGDGTTAWTALGYQAPDETTLKNTYAPQAANTIVLLGNSRVAIEDLVTGTARSSGERGVFVYGNARAGGRFNVLNCAGVSGNTLAQMIARWSTDVVPFAPAWVYIADAVNDASASRTVGQMIADYRTLIGLAKGIGARVILATAPPKDSHTTAQRDALNMVNRWIKEIQDTNVYPVDLATAVTNPVDGTWITAYHFGDGLHQSPAGAARMGRVLEPVLASLAPVRDMFPSGPTDAANTILNSFNSGTPGAGFPTPWQTTTTTGTPTYSTVARTDLIPGNWLEIDSTAGAADAYAKQFRNSIGTIAPGDTIRYLVEVQVVSITALTSLECSVFIRAADGSTNLFQITALGNSDTGTVDLADIPLGQTMLFRSPPVVVPVGGATMNLLNRFNGQGKVRFGRSALVKAAA